MAILISELYKILFFLRTKVTLKYIQQLEWAEIIFFPELAINEMTWRYITEQLSSENHCSMIWGVFYFLQDFKMSKKLGTLSLALMVISKCTLRLHLEFDRHRSCLTLMTVHELYEWRCSLELHSPNLFMLPGCISTVWFLSKKQPDIVKTFVSMTLLIPYYTNIHPCQRTGFCYRHEFESNWQS